MPKDFQKFASEEEHYSKFEKPKETIDPNIFTNDSIEQEIFKKQAVSFGINNSGHTLMSFITAPLTTSYISLQLSVLAHRNKYGDVSDMEKTQLMNMPKELTLQDKRRYELIIKSGVTGSNKPFRAPVYNSYREVFQALANQGFLGFYKGNFLGILQMWMNSGFKFRMMRQLEAGNYKFYHESPITKMIAVTGAFTVIDIMCHPVMMLQSRFILQNRLPNFSVYKSATNFLLKKFKRRDIFFQGAGGHLPKNIIFALGFLNLFPGDPDRNFMAMTALSSILAYPILTCIRRQQCQDLDPGMLPVRYSGTWHALKLIAKEEGIRGLYRGFSAYAVVTGATFLFVSYFQNWAEYEYDVHWS
jgi:hypothetical protein